MTNGICGCFKKRCNSHSENNFAVKTSHEKFKRPSRSEFAPPPAIPHSLSSRRADPVLTGRGYERQREDQRRKKRQRKIPVLWNISRVNGNASLGGAQWSALYPRMSRSTGTAAWWRGREAKEVVMVVVGFEGGGEGWWRAHQDKGQGGRGETKRVNKCESWQLQSLLRVSGCQVLRHRHDVYAFLFKKEKNNSTFFSSIATGCRGA